MTSKEGATFQGLDYHKHSSKALFPDGMLHEYYSFRSFYSVYSLLVKYLKRLIFRNEGVLVIHASLNS